MAIEVRYTATGLDDVAALFDERADAADKRGESARKASDRDTAAIEARTWVEAARIVRAATLASVNPSN